VPQIVDPDLAKAGTFQETREYVPHVALVERRAFA